MLRKQIYVSPEMKTFKVSLECNCCQAISNPPIDPYLGFLLGEDSF